MASGPSRVVSPVSLADLARGVKSLASAKSEEALARSGARLGYRRFRFDWQEAQRLVDGTRSRLGEPDWVSLSPEDVASGLLQPVERGAALFRDGLRLDALSPESARGEESMSAVEPADTQASPALIGSPLDSLSSLLDSMRVGDGATPTAPPGGGVPSSSHPGGTSGSERLSVGERLSRSGGGKKPSGRKATAPYAGMTCAGCLEVLGLDFTVDGGHMVHRRTLCLTLLREREQQERSRLRQTAANLGQTPLSMQELVNAPPGPTPSTLPGPFATEPPPPHLTSPTVRPDAASSTASDGIAGGDVKGSVLLRTKADERLNAARLGRIRSCLEGSCPHAFGVTPKFGKTMCSSGCGRGVHLVDCGDFGTARAAMGVLRCAYCRATEMAGERPITDSLLELGLVDMVVALSSGQETTAAQTAMFNRLETQFMMAYGLEGDFMLPRHNLERFIGFITWCFRTAKVGASMDALWRHMPTVFKAWGLTDLTKIDEAARHFKSFSQDSGVDKQPRAAATDRMVRIMCEDIIPAETEGNPFLAARDGVTYPLEAANGGRIGELTGSGQGHGVTTDSVKLVVGPAGECFIDFHIESSKTHHARYSGIVGVTRSGIDYAARLRRYWYEMGAASSALRTRQQGGWTLQWMDEWVVRVSLLGFDRGRNPLKGETCHSDDLRRLLAVLATSGNSSAIDHLASTKFYAGTRILASGPGSESKKFVNVAAGPKGARSLLSLVHALAEGGFGGEGRVHLVPSPFIRSTFGKRVSLMPLASGSTYDSVKKYLVKSALAANLDPADPDPDLGMSTDEIESAKWGTHSFRRSADRRARAWCIRHGISLDRVDKAFGWKEAEHSRDMQLHYDEDTLERRWEEAQVTYDL